ncbi:MAG: hypothetical protein U9R15_16065 [Chloroflexota bacterium]|nr:hypothetical protein [Chloroflexota bacterium]
MRDLRVWRTQVLESLMASGPICRHAAHYIIENNVEIGFARQSTAARWTLKGSIEPSSNLFSLATDPMETRLLGVIVHEVAHLEQGAALALSVAGEVEGWRTEHNARLELNAPIRNPHWAAVARTPDSPTDRELRQARREILQMTGYRYLVWLLPLRPNFWTRFVEAMQRNIWGRTRA